MPAVGAYAASQVNVFPVPTDKEPRAKFDITDNDTLCRVDQTYGHDRSLKGRVSVVEKATLEDPLQMIERSKGDIEEHIDRRIAFFFQQLICCYRAPFHFEIGETDAQGPSAPGVKLETTAKGKEVPFNSAHSATIPMLHAYPEKDWKDYQEGKAPKPAGFLYLKGSDYYRNSNSTLEMPKLINSADIALDGTKGAQSCLRYKALALLQRAAKGEIDPEEGLNLFLDEMVKVLGEVIKHTPKQATKKILEIYLEQVEEIQGEDELVDRLLTLQLSGEEATLRKTLLKKRYQMILRSQEVQSIARKKIATAKSEMVGIGGKPTNFDKVFKLKLLEKDSGLVRQELTKMFHLSIDQLRIQVAEAKVKEPAKKLIDRHPQKMDDLLKGLRSDFRGFNSEELTYRSAIMKTIRFYRGWTQQRMGEQYKAAFPHSPTSQSTICRLEREYKPINQRVGEELAELFGVDKGLFFLSLFTSP